MGRAISTGGGALPRKSALTGAAPTATLARPSPPPPASATSSYTPTRDTLLPGDSADTLVSATVRARPRTTPRTRVLAVCFAVATVMLIVWAVIGATHGGSSNVDPRLQAEALLRRVAVAAAPAYAPHHSFSTVTPSSLAHAARLTVVPETTSARAGEVSMKIASPTRLVTATPATKTTCLFALDDAGVVRFAITAGGQCRAALAPLDGWGSG